MREAEFITLEQYRTKLNEEKESTVKNAEFDSLMPLLLGQYPGIYIRDYLDIDGTFSVTFGLDKSLDYIDSIKLYTEIIDLITLTTYVQYAQTGFINFDKSKGFWILFRHSND